MRALLLDQATFIPVTYPEPSEAQSPDAIPEKPSRPGFNAAEEIKQFLSLSTPEPEAGEKPRSDKDGAKEGEAKAKPPAVKQEEGDSKTQ